MKNNIKGASLIEFAIVTPIVLLAFLACFFISLVFVGRGTVERFNHESILDASIDQRLICDPNNQSATCLNDVINGSNGIRTRLIGQLGVLLHQESDTGKTFMLADTVSPQIELGYNVPVPTAPTNYENPLVLIPLPFPGSSETREEAFERRPILIFTRILINSFIPLVPDIDTTIVTSRYFEVRKKSSHLVPRDCAGNPIGSPNYNQNLQCVCPPSHVISPITANCHPCNLPSVNVPEPGWLADPHGCYFPPLECEFGGHSGPVFNPTTNSFECTCIGGSIFVPGPEEDSCDCIASDTFNAINEPANGGWGWNQQNFNPPRCYCMNVLTDTRCEELYPLARGRVEADQGEFYPGCSCKCKPCPSNYTTPTLTATSTCECTECSAAYTGPDCETCISPPACDPPRQLYRCNCACPQVDCEGGEVIYSANSCVCVCPEGMRLENQICVEIDPDDGNG